MLNIAITLLVAALLLWIVYYVVGILAPGTPQRIIGIILAIVFLVYALNQTGLSSRL